MQRLRLPPCCSRRHAGLELGEIVDHWAHQLADVLARYRGRVVAGARESIVGAFAFTIAAHFLKAAAVDVAAAVTKAR